MQEDIADIFNEILTDDDDDIINFIERPRAPRNFRERIENIHIWTDNAFLQRFRISKICFGNILEIIGPRVIRNTFQNHAISPITQLLVALRFYACGSMLIVCGDFGGIHLSSASQIVKTISQAIASLSPQYIKMPEGVEEILETKRKFYNISRFPDVIGAIDCTHIRIQSPGGNNAEHIRNRKGWFSINVQTVSNAETKIIDIVARWPGAANDRHIFNNCRLKARLEQGLFGSSYILGDSGYTLSPHVMVPLGNPQTRPEHLYNESHIRTRNVVERQYGIWKRRFQVLRLEMRVQLQTVLNIIVATVVLHNLALDMHDPLPENDEDNNDPHDIDEIRERSERNGIQARQFLINYFAEL